jgi:hypothetical protein
MLRKPVWWLRLLACTAFILACGANLGASPVTAQDAGLTRESPVALGETAPAFGFEITVVDLVPNAYDMVMEYSTKDTPPAEGNQFFLARLRAVNTHPEAASINLALDFNAVGASELGYAVHGSPSCGEFPGHPYYIGEIEPGGEAEFNVCWQVAESDVSSLVMYVQPSFDMGEDPVWFSLGADPGSMAIPHMPPSPVAVVEDSTQQEPVPYGGVGPAGAYQVAVLDVESNANELVAAAYPLDAPPEPGKQFFVVTVSITNGGTDPGNPWVSLTFRAIGVSGAEYSLIFTPCGEKSGDLSRVGEIFPGGTATVDLCWQIDTVDADSLVMYVDPGYPYDETDRAWFSLQP